MKWFSRIFIIMCLWQKKIYLRFGPWCFTGYSLLVLIPIGAGREMPSIKIKMPFLTIYSRTAESWDKKDQFNKYLLMGTGIGRSGTHSRGTLGGFVDLPKNKIGFLTCAHVVTPEVIPDERIILPMDTSESESETAAAASLPIPETESQLNTTSRDCSVSQPADADIQQNLMSGPSRVCGWLYQKVFDYGASDDTSVDAAIIEITKRVPLDAKFVWVRDDQIKTAGYNTAKPPTFKEGRILTFDQLTEYKRMHLLKYGAETGLTVGSLWMWGTDLRLVNERMSSAETGRSVEMCNQIEISSHHESTRFFDLGDSGALVFMPTNTGQELYCVGLAIGKTSYGSCLATPIEKVFTKLGLPPKFKDFTYSQ